MRTLFIAAASALFFAALVTELSMRLWPGSYVALLVLCAIALFVSGTLNLKLAGLLGDRPARDAGRSRQRHQRRNQRESGNRERQGRSPRSAERSADRSARKGGNGKPAGDGGRRSAPKPAEPPPEGPRETGTVKWFNRTKGFGFVIRESGEEIFVHQRSIRITGEGDQRGRPNLKDGQTVTFVVAEREKGLQAEDVVPGESA
jgi:cold shock CspA family protein